MLVKTSILALCLACLGASVAIPKPASAVITFPKVKRDILGADLYGLDRAKRQELGVNLDDDRFIFNYRTKREELHNKNGKRTSRVDKRDGFDSDLN